MEAGEKEAVALIPGAARQQVCVRNIGGSPLPPLNEEGKTKRCESRRGDMHGGGARGTGRRLPAPSLPACCLLPPSPPGRGRTVPGSPPLAASRAGGPRGFSRVRGRFATFSGGGPRLKVFCGGECVRGGRGAARPAVVTRAWGAETIARPAGDTSKSRSPAGRRRGPARPPGQGRGAGLHVGSPGGGTSSPVAAAAAAAGSSPGPAGRRRGAAGRCLLPACLAGARRGGQLGGPGSPPRRRPFPARPPAPKGVVQTFPPGG